MPRESPTGEVRSVSQQGTRGVDHGEHSINLMQGQKFVCTTHNLLTQNYQLKYRL